MFVLTVATAVITVAGPSLVAAMFMKIIMGCGHRHGDYCGIDTIVVYSAEIRIFATSNGHSYSDSRIDWRQSRQGYTNC